MGAQKESKVKLGRLKSFGVTEPWQVALLLPKRFEDCRYVTRIADAPREGAVLVRGRVAKAPDVRFKKDGPNMMVSRIGDGTGYVGLTAFGDTRELQKALPLGAEVVLTGRASEFNGELWLRDPEVLDPVWIGRCRPVYGGIHQVMKPETVRERVKEHLREAVPIAAQWLIDTLELGSEKRRDLVHAWLHEAGITGSVADLHAGLSVAITRAHVPRTPELGYKAWELLDRVAALGVYLGAARAELSQAPPKLCASIDPAPRAKGLPFTMSRDQKAAVMDCVRDIGSGLPMRRLINGDVGTGKTAVFGVVAAGVLDAGGRVAIMLPSEPLAKQVFDVLTGWWPDLLLQAGLVTGDCDAVDLASKRLLVGTTALLHRDVGAFALVVADEQQKYSVGQREGLVSPGTHLIEASATCICRSQALVRYGFVQVSQLKERHVERRIETRIWEKDEKRALFQDVLESISRGEQVLVIYPVRSTTKKDGLPSADDAWAAWDRKFPGRVRLAHAGRGAEENGQAIADLRNGSADILVCTQIVEIGLDLPEVRRVMVMHPDRFGLTVLHQMRGRAARTGGVGYFDLMVEREISEDSRARLEVLVNFADGFDVSREDLRLRGFGDLSTASEKQTGSDETFLFGRAVSVDALDAIAEAGV